MKHEHHLKHGKTARLVTMGALATVMLLLGGCGGGLRVHHYGGSHSYRNSCDTHTRVVYRHDYQPRHRVVHRNYYPSRSSCSTVYRPSHGHGGHGHHGGHGGHRGRH